MKGFDDKILSLISYPFGRIEYSVGKSGNSLNKIVFLNKQAKKVFFILSHWMAGTALYNPLINKLKDNYTVIICKLPDYILSDNVFDTIKYFKKIKKYIINATDKLEKRGYENFFIMGLSLSCIPCLMVANSDARFKKIIINLVGSDFSECLWHTNSYLAKNIKNKIAKKCIDLITLKEYWEDIHPINNIDNLKDRELFILLSRNDQIIKYEYGLKLLKALESKNIKYKIETNNIFGHFLSIWKLLLFPDKIVKFLEA